MRKWIFPALLLCSSVAMAAPEAYHIESELTVNGKRMGTARIITLANEKAEVAQNTDDGNGYFIGVTPSEGQGEIKGRKAILMKFVVGIIEKGQRKILGEPQIMTAENNKAEVSVGRPGASTDSFNLSVIAERQ